MDIVEEIIKFESDELNDWEVLELFSELIKSGQAWTLQGHFGRTANMLISGGFLSPEGEITENYFI